jgi:hypothetical protein
MMGYVIAFLKVGELRSLCGLLGGRLRSRDY